MTAPGAEEPAAPQSSELGRTLPRGKGCAVRAIVGTYQFPKSVRNVLPTWNCSMGLLIEALEVYRLGLDDGDLLGDGPQPVRGR